LLGGGAGPQVVIDTRRSRVDTLLPDRRTILVAQSAGELHVADLPGADVFNGLDRAPHRTALRPRVADPAVLASGLHDPPSFAQVVARRLPDGLVFAGLHRPDRSQRVQVVGRGDGDDVDRLVTHPPPQILHVSRLLTGRLFDSCRTILPDRLVHVANGH